MKIGFREIGQSKMSGTEWLQWAVHADVSATDWLDAAMHPMAARSPNCAVLQNAGMSGFQEFAQNQSKLDGDLLGFYVKKTVTVFRAHTVAAEKTHCDRYLFPPVNLKENRFSKINKP